ncbi:hypothetical protein K470DRAFT_72642 [Piedraia hortae CBS 480.64]|uniref:PHD-type domain-containing protein n=1 Tax=Piedraia hortae CBS 480.64 TaxID=1314780 RepID=A0A6A7BZV5_9PEZI|nr:hypothetical protein K470DRAFT_72642 [Piedraia hortae CBS 480.64]
MSRTSGGSLSQEESTLSSPASSLSSAALAQEWKNAQEELKISEAVADVLLRSVNDVPDPETPAPPPGRRPRGRPRGASNRGRGNGRGRKRRRVEGSDDEEDSSGEEVITPGVLMTKSGRSVQKPTSFMPQSDGQPRRQRRKRDLNACKNCSRSVSLEGNRIVHCDSCATPYHRYCHYPPIDDSVISGETPQWLCSHCEKNAQQQGQVPGMVSAAPDMTDTKINRLVNASGVPEHMRRHYFSTLPVNTLVDLLTNLSSKRPTLTLFAPHHSRVVFDSLRRQARGTETPDQSILSHNSEYQMRIEQDEIAFQSNPSYGDHPDHYPRPGYGKYFELPPEQEETYLADNDEGVFLHLYREAQ